MSFEEYIFIGEGKRLKLIKNIKKLREEITDVNWKDENEEK